MLRVRLILWYSLLVALTVTAVGFVQVLIIQRSMIEGLETSLMDDAQSTLRIVSSLPSNVDPEKILQHGQVHTSETLRDLIDHVLTEVPDTVKGVALTDRVMSSLVDAMLTELSFNDSSGKSADPLDAIVQRNIASRRNNLVEIHLRPSGKSPIGSGQILFHTTNLTHDTLSHLFEDSSGSDTSVVAEEIHIEKQPLRVVRVANDRFVVYVAYPSTDIEDALRRLRSSFLYLIPLSLAVSIFGGLWLARKALAPIERIADTAREIGAKNLSQRIELPARTDRELRELTATLNSMFARLENSFSQITQFTSDASHELKTPLAIMKGEIEQADRHLASAEKLDVTETRQTLESLMEEVERMQRIVEGLLLISRADEKQLPLTRESINLYDFLKSLGEDAEILASERGLALNYDLDPSLSSTSVLIDPTRFYQVIMNLLDNALKYTNEGSVTLLLHRGRGTVLVGIADTGIGIAQEEIGRVFQRFYRTDVARSGPREVEERSLGLGLAIVKSIVEAHGGTIAVESQIGKGTTFTIELPAVEQTEEIGVNAMHPDS